MKPIHLVTRHFTNRISGDPVAYFKKNPDGTMQDSIGESIIIELTTGTTADLMAATFAVPYVEPFIQADIDEGGNIFFESLNAMAPIVRSGAEWYDMLNGSYVWIGPHPTRGGIAVYSEDMIAYSSKIQGYLGYYTPTISGWADETGAVWADENGAMLP